MEAYKILAMMLVESLTPCAFAQGFVAWKNQGGGQDD